MAATTGCLDETTLTLLVEDRLAPTDRAATEEHIDTCGTCRQLLGGMMAGGTGGTSGASRPNVDLAGTLIDRYVTVSELGFGAMGRVYLAIDPELDRKVAIKLLRRLDPGGDHDLRLRREAQALARIAHPNVAAIYDVGEVDGNLFLAMEYVGGGTLSAWLRAKPRAWQEIVRVFAAAGRGLAAVHARGLIHRDFKPDNVLLDEQGGAKVTDFGLVTTLSEHGGGLELGSAEGLDVVGALTVTGAVLGTPAYMSPEQFDSGVVDARSDQFSFCVALYEALYSARPFPGKDVAELKVGLSAPAIEPSAAQRKGSPRWLHQVVARGLAHDPARRFASMDQLVTALGFDQRRRRRNRVVTVVAGAAVIGLATAWIAGGSREEPGCTTAAAEIGATWNDPERAAVRAAIARSTLPFAADAAAGVVAALDRYAARWQASHTAVCEATRVKHTQSTAAMDLRMSCLARRKRELESLIDVLVTAPPELTEHARDAVAGLPSLAACDDVAALSGVMPMPADPVVRGEIDGVRANLVRADVWLDSGMLVQTRPMLEAQLATATRIGYPPLEAEVLIVRGRMEVAQGSFGPAAATYQAAAATADRGRDDRTRFRASAGEVTALGSAGTLDAAEARLPAAAASLERAGSDAQLAELWAETRARLHYLRGRIDEATALYQDAIANARARGDRHALGALLDAQVVTTLYSSDPAKVLPLAEESFAISIEEYGPLHPEPARREASLGRVLDLQGKLDDALARLTHARESLAAVYGADHAEIARIGLTIGAVYRTMGRNDDARTELVQSLKVVRAAFGDNHFIVADALTDLAMIERRDGNFDAGLGYAREAQRILESTLGPTTDGLVATHHTIGVLLREKGERVEAEQSFLAGLAIGEKIAPDNPRLALFHGMIGSIRLERNDAAGAEHHLLRAIEIYAKGAADPVNLAYMRLDLAYAKEALGKWSEVLELVTLARDAMRAPEDIAEAEKMLAKVKKRMGSTPPP